LVSTRDITIQSDSHGYEFFIETPKKSQVVPAVWCHPVVDHLLDYPVLWKQAQIRLDYKPSLMGGLPVFGVPFKRAVEIALEKGHIFDGNLRIQLPSRSIW
jgi:hypothetical protein